MKRIRTENKEDTQSKRPTLSPFRNRQRVLVFGSRGLSARQRFLMNDFRTLLPHSKSEVKFDLHEGMNTIPDVCDAKNCNSCIFFECRRHEELYLWFAKTPVGPSFRFHVKNLHTMMELQLLGNCMKGSRPILSFDEAFDSTETYRLMKEVFVLIMGTPRNHVESKPFVDHVFMFSIADHKIWFRNYQIIDEREQVSQRRLVEVGPRFVLDPQRLLSGAFQGETLWENKYFESPTDRRTVLNEKLAATNRRQRKQRSKRSEYESEILEPEEDPYEDLFD